jgi:preprotein translocase subunit SecG
LYIFGGLKMNVWEIILGILMIIVSLVIIGVVLLQQGHRAGINGAVSGGADTFLSKNKARTADALLARLTKWVAIGFFVLAVVANVIALNK